MLTGIQNFEYPSGTLMYSIHRNPSGLFKYCTWNRKDLKQKRHSLVLPRLQPIEGRHSLKPLVHPCEGRHHWGGPRERPSDVLVDRFYGVLPKKMCLYSTYCSREKLQIVKLCLPLPRTLSSPLCGLRFPQHRSSLQHNRRGTPILLYSQK